MRAFIHYINLVVGFMIVQEDQRGQVCLPSEALQFWCSSTVAVLVVGLKCEFSAGTEMAQLVCGGCHTLLMYIRGATSVQCSCCHTVNLAMEGRPTKLQYYFPLS
jgi:LSD1 subclass zinc finger protein